MTGATEFESKDELRQLTELGKHILRRRNSKYKGPAGNKLVRLEWQELGQCGWSTVGGGGVEGSEPRETGRARMGGALRELHIILSAAQSHSKFNQESDRS